MEKTHIIITVILSIISAFAGSLFKAFFAKIFADFNPDKKKIISFMKYSFLFSIKYILPIAVLTNLYIKTETVDKSFVFFNIILLFVILINFTQDFNK